MIWDTQATLDLVQKQFGRKQRDAAYVCVSSVNQRVRYAAFHYATIEAELDAFQTKLGDRHLFEVSHGADNEQEEHDYYAFMDRVGAHAVACVQSIHALEDLLSAMVYRCLNLDTLGAVLDEHQLSLQKTVTRLGQDPKYAKVMSLLQSLQTDNSFAHVDALSNKAKHSAIVRPWISQDQTGTRADPLLFFFGEFERRGTPYPQVTFKDVLVPALAFVARTRTDIGIELTALLT